MQALLSPNRYLYLFIFIGAFVLFANTIQHDYAWDDKIAIQENPRVKKGLSGIPDLFAKDNSQWQYSKYGYRPVPLISFAIDYSLSNGNPHFSHFMNVFFYAILCVLIYILIQMLFPTYHMGFHLMVTLLFMVHPLHTEVVANIKSRDEIFGLMFSALALIGFVKYLNTQKILYFLGSIAVYLLAYLSKENYISVLFLFPLVFIIRKEVFSLKKLIIVLGSVVVLVTTSIVIFRLSQSSTAGIESSAGMGIYEENGILGNSFMRVGDMKTKLPNAALILLLYIKLFFIPYPLRFYYGYNQIPVTSFSDPWVWVSILVHIGALVIGIMQRNKRPEILFGWLFYLITIFLFTHLIRPLSDTMAERFMFLPSLGLAIFTAGIASLAIRKTWVSKNQLSLKEGIKSWFNNYKPVAYTVTAAGLIFAVLTMQRNTVWKNDMTLIKNDLPHLQNCSRAHYYYASLLNMEIHENPNKRLKYEKEMVQHYEQAIKISDDAYLAYLDLGKYLCETGKLNEGIVLFLKGVALFPDAPDMHMYLGQAYLFTNRADSAIPHLEKSIELAYNNPNNYYLLAITYPKTGRYDDALKIADKGLMMFPEEKARFYDAKAHIYFDQKNVEECIKYTLMLKDYGKPENQVYSIAVQRCIEMGAQERAGELKEIARLKGITIQ